MEILSFSGRDVKILHLTELILGLYERSRQNLKLIEEHFPILCENYA